MHDLTKEVLERFDALLRELNLPYDVVTRAKGLAEIEVNDFIKQEQSSGLYKTRRPKFGRQFFESQVERAQEMIRREKEEVNLFCGEEDAPQSSNDTIK